MDSLSLRATRSRDFRAPSLDETFRAQTVTFTGFQDWITGNPRPANNIRTEGGGNPNLKSELGDTLTYGVVVRPTPNFDIALDAFNIKIKDAIFLAQGNNPNIQQTCYASGGSSQYCQLIGRGLGIYDSSNPQAASAANAVTLWRQTFINLAEIETYGADIEAGYRTRIAARPLSVRLLATYQPHVIYRLPGAAAIDYANSAFGTNAVQASPVWRATAFVSYKPTDKLSLSLQTRWRSSVERTPEVDVEGTPPVESVSFTNFNISDEPKTSVGTPTIFLNIQNLFNTPPPAAGNYLNPTPGNFGEYLQGDDVLGRFYTVGIRFRM
jgi:outer membrane receptor protein involved in Fe transport